MEQLIREIRLWYKLKGYKEEDLKRYGIYEDEDIARLLYDHRKDVKYDPEQIVDEFIEDQKIYYLLEDCNED